MRLDHDCKNYSPPRGTCGRRLRPDGGRYSLQRLDPRLADFVDRDGRARRESELRPMWLATENVGHVPIGWARRSRNRGAALHVLRIDPIAAVHVGADRGATDGADRRRDVVTSATAHLMP